MSRKDISKYSDVNYNCLNHNLRAIRKSIDSGMYPELKYRESNNKKGGKLYFEYIWDG